MRVLIMIILMGGASIGLAQEQSSPYANPQNLKVLPKDISEQKLRETMRNFSLGTGFRCSQCHVRAERKPLNEWDFRSDEKDFKLIARQMLQMTASINKKIGKIDELQNRDVSTVKVRCITCHRGVNRPQLIQDILNEYLTAGDAQGAADRYRELHAIYFGSHAYDFSPFALGDYAVNLTSNGDVEFAMVLHNLNLELNPHDPNAYFNLGQSFMEVEDYDGAVEAFENAVKFDPENEFFKAQLEKARELALTKQGN